MKELKQAALAIVKILKSQYVLNEFAVDKFLVFLFFDGIKLM